MKERGDKGKKNNEYAQLITAEKNQQLLTILMDGFRGTTPRLSVKEKQNVLQKGISSNFKNSYNNHAHKGWEVIVDLCDKTQMEYITFRATITY